MGVEFYIVHCLRVFAAMPMSLALCPASPLPRCNIKGNQQAIRDVT
jgi:hypothetical protein